MLFRELYSILLGAHMASLEDLKRKFINIHRMYLETNNWVISAFYADSDVNRLNKMLYDRWVKGGMKGIPLDYASERELLFLIKKANSYAGLSPTLIMRQWVAGGGFPKPSKAFSFLYVLKRLFLGGR